MKARGIHESLLVVVLLILGGIGVAAAGSLEPPGPPNPTMKTISDVAPGIPVETLPGATDALHVISQPGHYFLTRNITGESGKSGIKVLVSDVTIDLAGFALIGVPGSATGILTEMNLYNIRVSHGTVRGWSDGILLHSNSGEISGVTAIENGGIGITIWAGRIADSFVRWNGGSGIRLDGPGIIEHCTAIENDWGIQGVGGVLVTGCTLRQNTNGVNFAFDGVVQDSYFESNNIGIYTWNSTVVTRCNFAENQIGVFVVDDGQGNQIERNNFASGEVAVRLSTTARGNMIIQNTARTLQPPFEIPAGNTFGPLVDISTAEDISSIPGAQHPWANFLF